jgi:hypothetical protein
MVVTDAALDFDLDFCKMDIGPTLGRKNLPFDFSFPNNNPRTEHELGRFFKEIEE